MCVRDYYFPLYSMGDGNVLREQFQLYWCTHYYDAERASSWRSIFFLMFGYNISYHMITLISTICSIGILNLSSSLLLWFRAIFAYKLKKKKYNYFNELPFMITNRQKKFFLMWVVDGPKDWLLMYLSIEQLNVIWWWEKKKH